MFEWICKKWTKLLPRNTFREISLWCFRCTANHLHHLEALFDFEKGTQYDEYATYLAKTTLTCEKGCTFMYFFAKFVHQNAYLFLDFRNCKLEYVCVFFFVHGPSFMSY